MNRHELIAHCLAVARSIAPEHRADPTRVFIGMVGYPNVGKSSTINVLCGKKRVAVSATPGRTKHFQTIVLSNDATLCDCPGLVFPTFMASRSNLVINGVLPIDQMHDYLGPIQQICSRIGTRQWREAYGLVFPNWQTVHAEELLLAHAKMRGFIKDHGRPDGSRSARLILKDFVTGKLLYCSPPPHLTADQRHVFHTSYTRVHIASRKNKVPSADDEQPDAGTTPAIAAGAAAAAAGAADDAQPRSQLVVIGAAGAAGAAARDPNAPPVIAEAERGLLEEMYHVSKPLTKTQYRKAKKDKSVLQVMDQNSGKGKGKKGKKLRKQTIALGDVEAHTNGKNPIANFRRFDMLQLSSEPATAPLGAVPTASTASTGGKPGVRRPGGATAAGAAGAAGLSMLPPTTHR